MNKEVVYQDEDSTAHITVTIPQKDVVAKYEALINEYLKETQMPGFRKGHVPKPVFEKKYAQSIQAESASKLIEEHLQSALTDLEREVVRVRSPQVEKMDRLELDKDFTFTLKVDVMPKMNINGYSKVSAPSYQVEVTEEDINTELKRLQEQNAFVVNKDGVAESGDVLDVNYVELDSSGLEVTGTQRQNFVFTLGNGQNLYDWDNELMGVKVREEKTFTKDFPSDYVHSDLSGKSITLKVLVNSLKGKNLPALDDEFAQDVSDHFKTLEELKADIRDKFTQHSQSVARIRRCDEILKELVEKEPFNVPEGLVLSEIEARFSQLARQMNMSEDQLLKMVGGETSGLVEQWRPESESAVKNKLIIEDIIAKENIVVTTEEFDAHAEKLAKEYRSSVEQLSAQVGDTNFKAYIEEQVKSEKALDWLSSQAKISKQHQLSLTEFNQLG
ncbi:trigger factor [Entomospira culicis]|uniref:Trigger factor n=1 Tax=Entomospira culicis TaxID=2719989 RepID=A0A968GGJ4_9SPIO|nr:trigger factor [Entomospira culicis]NIZ19207.1 trigger factor [Entomospira culicis]NIZ69421.1 trigger factor [Entomospira culicis]WDI36537.1 trigger factor [Entomospira culicis]WDI38163.1 trigger factor [Entomospira culicis]